MFSIYLNKAGLLFHNKNLILPILFYIVNLIIQNYNLGKIVNVSTDEGVYLYSAKLLGEGLIPYRDFFLTHPPYLLYPASFILFITNFNLNLFHFLYTAWVFSIIFPIYFIILKFTKSRLATSLGIILLSTFSEFVQWDPRFFALRQASLPFLSFSLYFIFYKPRPKIAGLMLGLFAISLIQNLILSLCLIISILLSDCLQQRVSFTMIKKNLKQNLPFLSIFSLIFFFGYITILLIPNGYNNIVLYQLERPFLPYLTRLEWINLYILRNNWPILLTGIAGLFIFVRRAKIISFYNIFSILTIFFGSSFYPHYISPLVVGFTISSGLLFSYLIQPLVGKIIVTSVILISIFYSSYSHLKYNLIERVTPDFFQIVNVLRDTPEPLFTFEPIYGLYAKKNLTFHYYVADMRYFRVLYKNLDEQSYLRELKKSRTILLEPFALAFIPLSIRNYIDYNFRSVYSDGINTVYIKKS